MYNVPEIPAHKEVSFRYACKRNMQAIVVILRCQDPSSLIAIGQLDCLWTRSNKLMLTREDFLVLLPNLSWCSFQLSGQDIRKQWSEQTGFEIAHQAIRPRPELLIKAAPYNGGIDVDSRSLHGFVALRRPCRLVQIQPWRRSAA